MARTLCGPSMSGSLGNPEARSPRAVSLLGSFAVAPPARRILSLHRAHWGAWTCAPFRGTREGEDNAAKDVLDVVRGSGGQRGPSVAGAGHGAQALQLGCLAADERHRGVRAVDAGAPRRGSEISARALRALSEHGRSCRPLGSAQQARVSDDAARGVLPALRPRRDLRRQLPRYRLRSDHHRAARRRPHDKLDRRQDRREGARDRHRLRLSVRLSRRT